MRYGEWGITLVQRSFSTPPPKCYWTEANLDPVSLDIFLHRSIQIYIYICIYLKKIHRGQTVENESPSSPKPIQAYHLDNCRKNSLILFADHLEPFNFHFFCDHWKKKSQLSNEIHFFKRLIFYLLVAWFVVWFANHFLLTWCN